MKAKPGSLIFVVLGDWNKLYTTPRWLISRIFPKDVQVEVELYGTDLDVNLRCNYKGVTVIPDKDKSTMKLICNNMEADTIDFFQQVVVDFIKNVPSPEIRAYGFNIDMIDDEDDRLPENLDHFWGERSLTEKGVLIEETKVSVKLAMENKTFNCTLSTDNKNTILSVNEHHDENKDSSQIELPARCIESFLAHTKKIVEAFGYDLEEGDSI